jgi:hypothetical protein
MQAPSQFDPIFVHASPRSGSTYFFNVLRRNESLLCFNEAISDGKDRFTEIPQGRLEAQKQSMNHHFLECNDFAEFVEARDAAMHLCLEFPEFHDYLPPKGVLSSWLFTYLSALMKHARSQGKRPVLCEIYSRGRVGALRAAFGGFHIAQYRNPFSQFGSFIHLVIEQGWWAFLAFPLRELGISGMHPLYRLVPEPWRVPALPWPANDRAQRWATEVHYMATVASPRLETIENVFRWHLFSWVLSNLAAVSYSDLTLDIDNLHDDADYRASVIRNVAGEIGVAPNVSDIRKFDRYYEFESFNVAVVCNQVVSTIRSALADGRLDAALRTLGIQPPITPAAAAVERLLEKIRDSLAAMTSTTERRYISVNEWKGIAEKNQRIWFNSNARWLAQHLYPVAAPVVRAARRAGIPI